MHLFRGIPPHLIICAGVIMTPASLVWAQEPGSSVEAPGFANEAPSPQLKETADAQASGDTPAWDLQLGGYLRTKYSTVQNDANYQLIGRRDGFSLADVALAVDGSLENGVGFNVVLEGAAGLPKGADNEDVELGTRLLDAFLYYAPHDLVRISVGQFKAPYDAETLQSTKDLLFVGRSVGNQGVSGLDGMPVLGLSQGRQVGLRLDSEPYYFLNESQDAAPNGPALSYALAVTNGQKVNLRFNENDKMAYYGRLNLHWGDLIRLGGAGFYNERTLGAAPDRLNQKNVGWTGDLTANAYGVSLLANITQVEVTPAPELRAEQSRTARSMQAQIAYEEPFLGLQPAYRFAYYDPDINNDGSANVAYEALTYHTFGLNYNSPDYPVRILLNYTVTGEDVRSIDNNRFDALAQIVW